MYKLKAISYDTRARIFWTFVMMSAAFLGLYIYGVNATVRNTVARQTLEAEAADVSAELGELEFSYIALKNNVSLSVAYARGFQDASAPVYVSRSQGGSLSMNTLRR